MEVLPSLLALLLTLLIKEILHAIELLVTNVPLLFSSTILAVLFWLYKMTLPPYVEPLAQLGEEEGSALVAQQRGEEGTVLLSQNREEGSVPVPEPRNSNVDVFNQNNNVADAISKINFRLASEPGFIIDNECKRCLIFKAIPEPGHAGFVAILDDFWGQLFDFEGKLTKKAKLIKLDALLGLDVQPGIEYSRYFNSLMKSDFEKPVQPSTLVMPNTINSAYSEVRNLVTNSFLYEEGRNLNDHDLVTLIIKAHQQQNNSPNYVVEGDPVYEMVRPFIDTNPILAFSPLERETARISGFFSVNESKLLVSFAACIRNLLNLDGSLFLFGCNYSYEESLIGFLASREHLSCWTVDLVPNCGQGCIWQGNLIVWFGVWCIKQLFEFLLVETHTEIWLRCTSLLNRLKGIIELAFLVEQPPLLPCFLH